jgi:hypothetical protein
MASIGAQRLQMLLRRSREVCGSGARAYCATVYKPRDIAVPRMHVHSAVSGPTFAHGYRRVDAVTRRRAGAMMRF